MTSKNKSNIFYILIVLSVVISVYFTYIRSFETKDFEIIRSKDIQVVAPTVNISTTSMEGFEVSSTTVSASSNQ